MSDAFIKNPFLPEKEVKVCIVSCDAEDIIKSLENRGISVLRVKRSEKLPEPISSHADLQVLPLGDNLIAINEEQEELIYELLHLGFEIIPVTGFSSEYPYDCVLNHLIIKNHLFGNKKAIASNIISLNSFEIINVRQGYTKCSSILFDTDTVITDDISIYRTIKKYIRQAFIVEQNEVILQGYDHGFIGGTCGKLNKSLICFAGKIPETAFGNSLKSLLNSLAIDYIQVGEDKLRDIGGIIPILI